MFSGVSFENGHVKLPSSKERTKQQKKFALLKRLLQVHLKAFLAVNLILQEVKPVRVLYRKQLAQVGKISSNFMFQNE